MGTRLVTQIFPPFLQGGSGAGVLLLRLALACSLAQSLVTGSDLRGFPQALAFLFGMSLVAMLIVGLGTPVAGGLVCLLQLSMSFAMTESPRSHLLQAAIGLSITLLGPGFLSADAHLFGRRRVEIPESDNG